MKDKVLVNLDVVTEYLKTGKGLLPGAYEKFSLEMLSVTYTTLLASETFKDSSLESEVTDFAKKYFTVSIVDEKTALKAAELIRNNGLNLADSFLAAYCVVNNVALLTNDSKSFKGITGLVLASV